MSSTCPGAASASSSAADVIDGSAVRAGDAIVGLAASGLHANGFSLVRTLIAQWDLDLAEPYQARLRRSLGDAEADAAVAAAPNEAMATLGEVLLTPTRIYARAVLAARAELRAAGHDIHGIAHITGGGLPGNVPRALPDGLAARLDPSALADAVGHAPVRRAGRARRRGAARDVQRRPRDGRGRAAGGGRGGDRGARRRTGSRRSSSARWSTRPTRPATRYVEGALESVG